MVMLLVAPPEKLCKSASLTYTPDIADIAVSLLSNTELLISRVIGGSMVTKFSHEGMMIKVRIKNPVLMDFLVL